MGKCDLSGITAFALGTVHWINRWFGGQGCTRDADTQCNPTPLLAFLLVSDEAENTDLPLSLD